MFFEVLNGFTVHKTYTQTPCHFFPKCKGLVGEGGRNFHSLFIQQPLNGKKQNPIQQ